MEAQIEEAIKFRKKANFKILTKSLTNILI